VPPKEASLNITCMLDISCTTSCAETVELVDGKVCLIFTNMQLLHQMCKLAMMMHLLHSVLPVKLSLGKPSSGTAGKMELPCCVSFSFCYIEILAKFNNNIAKLFNFTLEK
jgi:hypothetical protein